MHLWVHINLKSTFVIMTKPSNLNSLQPSKDQIVTTFLLQNLENSSDFDVICQFEIDNSEALVSELQDWDGALVLAAYEVLPTLDQQVCYHINPLTL